MSEMTVRSNLETIRDKLYFALLLTTSHKTSLEATRIARESAVAALELLDAAERMGRDRYGVQHRLLADPEMVPAREYVVTPDGRRWVPDHRARSGAPEHD